MTKECTTHRCVFADLASGFAEAAEARDDVTFMRLDSAFNKLLLDACTNPFAAQAMRGIQGLSRRRYG